MASSTPESDRSTESWWGRFKQLLDDQTEWPSEYVFKFIAPRDRLEELKAVFGDHPVTVRASRRGNYVSVTARMTMSSSAEVVEVYERAGGIEGVVSL
jgi:putative lipoic acid-binding regulatory protein